MGSNGLPQPSHHAVVSRRPLLPTGGNDVEALRGVGLGIAMANGSDAAKEAATRTSSWEYTEDAVARELQQLVVDGAFGPGVRLEPDGAAQGKL